VKEQQRKGSEEKPGKVTLQERFIEMRAEGHSYDAIAKALHTSKPTLIAWGKTLTMEISNARALRMDELYQRYTVAKDRRIQVFGEQLDRIMAELGTRDLSRLKTESLFTLALKYGAALASERTAVQLSEPDETFSPLESWKSWNP